MQEYLDFWEQMRAKYNKGPDEGLPLTLSEGLTLKRLRRAAEQEKRRWGD